MRQPAADSVVRAMQAKGYRIHDDGRENPVAIRSANSQAGEFDDWLCLLRKTSDGWHLSAWRGTTDPGLYFLKDHLLSKLGAAILVPGQYRDAYKLDLHQGKYRALCQRLKAVRVYRDLNRNKILDCDPNTEDEGFHGINWHYDAHSSLNESNRVYKASAGCMVFAVRSDFFDFREDLDSSAEKFGNVFDATLLTENDLAESPRIPDPPSEFLTALREGAVEEHEERNLVIEAGIERFGLLARWQTMEITRLQGLATEQTGKIVDNQSRYQTIASECGRVPWWLIGAIHMLESGGSFSKHLHNGDPLSARTTHVPKGRPVSGEPPFSFEESAADAIRMKNWHQWQDWDIVSCLDRAERYNGTGYRNLHKNVPSPYLWSGSQHYVRGKYSSDGIFDPDLVSQQVGVAVLLKMVFDRVGLVVR